jgi:hypothetical protein
LQKFDEQIAALEAAKYHSADYLNAVNWAEQRIV